MEKYIQAAYEFYRQDAKESPMTYEQFKTAICKPSTPFWVWLASGAAVGYALKK